MKTLFGFGMRAGLQSFVMFVLMHGMTNADTSAMMMKLARDGIALVGFLLLQATVG